MLDATQIAVYWIAEMSLTLTSFSAQRNQLPLSVLQLHSTLSRKARLGSVKPSLEIYLFAVTSELEKKMDQ